MTESNRFSFDVSRDVANKFNLKSGLLSRGRDDFPMLIRSSYGVFSDKFFDLFMFGHVAGHEKAVPPEDFVTVYLTFSDEHLTVDDVRSMLDAVIGADCYYNLRIDGYFDTSRVYDSDGVDLGPRGFFKPYEVDENNIYLGPSTAFLSSLSDEARMEVERDWEIEVRELEDRYYCVG